MSDLFCMSYSQRTCSLHLSDLCKSNYLTSLSCHNSSLAVLASAPPYLVLHKIKSTAWSSSEKAIFFFQRTQIMCWRAAYSIMSGCVSLRACWRARMKPGVIVYPFPCCSSVLVSCSLSLTLELWQGFRLSWQEGELDKTDLFHLIWKMSPLPYDHFSDSLSCQWESGHCARSLSRGTNGLFFVVVAQLYLRDIVSTTCYTKRSKA